MVHRVMKFDALRKYYNATRHQISRGKIGV
jgi:hypothetical protein